jgi:lipoate-protein ligase A
MALDAELLDLCVASPERAVVRFYRMDPPAVTIGRHQRWRRVVDPEMCALRGWDWVRRPTGGGALLHLDEINYTVVVGREVLSDNGLGGFREAFMWIADGLAVALSDLDAKPEVHAGRSGGQGGGRTRQHGLCGRSLTRYEISQDGAKLVAAAQMVKSGAVLQHGTVYLRAPDAADRFWPDGSGDETTAGAISPPADPIGTASMISRPQALPINQRWTDLGPDVRALGWSEAVRRLEKSFVRALGIRAGNSEPSDELRRAIRVRLDRWCAHGWDTRR